MPTYNADVTATVQFQTPYQDEDGWHGSGLLADIIRAAAGQLLTDLRADVNYDRGAAAKALQKAVDAHVAGLLDEALSRLLTETNTFGSPLSEPKPLEDVIVARVDAFLSQSAREDSYGRNERSSLIGKTLNAEVAKVVKAELSTALAEAAATVRRAVEAEGARMLAETVAKLRREV